MKKFSSADVDLRHRAHTVCMNLRPYEKLIAWQESYGLFLKVNGMTKQFPPLEKYSLVTQMRKAAYSAPMNIAEGNARRSKKDKRRFFEIALASLEELHCQIRIAADLEYISAEESDNLKNHLQRTSFLTARLRNSFK